MGISKDKIDQVMNKDLQINRVGLKNVQERIRLNYGPGYGLTVTGGPAGGTVVTFRLPPHPIEKGGAPCFILW